MVRKADSHQEVMDMLLATSRTFYIPISRLTPNIKEAVASAYLCMRAIDEIEDHHQLPAETKTKLLHTISQILKQQSDFHSLQTLFEPYAKLLPKVTLKLKDWIEFAPATIRENILHWTSVMAEGMANWAEK